MEKKQTPSSDWSRNVVGPYRILKRLRGVATAEEVGRVYVARNRATGRPALVVAPGGKRPWVPGEWRLRLRASTFPAFLALEVERAPAGLRPLAQLSEGLDVLTCALEGLEDHPDAPSHLRSTPNPAPNAKRSWALHAGAFGGAAAGVFLAALIGVLMRPGTPTAHAPTVAAPVSAAEEALSAPERLPVASLEGRAQTWTALMLDMPSGPFRGQYRVDERGKCKGKRETPINGGCWIGLKGKAPCGDDAYEWKGECYWPSMPAGREPSSLRLEPNPLPAGRAQ